MMDKFGYGDLIRVTETHEVDGRMVSKGAELLVEDFVPAGEDPEDDLPFDWYYCTDLDGCGNFEVAADKVELVKTAQQMRNRKLPTPEEIIRELHCMDDYGVFEIDSADAPDGASREISGRTSEGLSFVCTITVSGVNQVDW